MTRIAPLLVRLVPLLVVLSPALTCLAADAALNPVALGVLSSGDVVILDRDGTLAVLRLEEPRRIEHLARFGAYRPVDMTVGRVSSEDRIFVSMVWPVSAERELVRIVAFDAAGRQVEEWPNLPSRVGGLALSADGTTLYFAEIFDRDIGRISLSGGGPERVARLFQAQRLGDMVVDPGRSRLYVCDPGRGQVLTAGTTGGRLARLTDGVGVPSALAFDEARDRVLGLNLLDGTVWSIDLTESGVRPELVTELPAWNLPLGLAVSPDGTIWVGDAGDRTVFRFSAQGEFVETIDLRRIESD